MITHALPLERINETFDPIHGGESIRSAMAYQKPSPSMGEGWVGVWPLGRGMNASGRRRPTAPSHPRTANTPNPALPPSRGKGSEWVLAGAGARLPLGNPDKSA